MTLWYLPNSLVCSILCAWIDDFDLVNVESASCNYSAKQSWKTALRSVEFQVLRSIVFKNEKLIKWLTKHEIRINDVVFDSAVDPIAVSFYFRKFGSFVRSVRFEIGARPAVAQIVAIYCRNLVRVLCLAYECAAVVGDIVHCNPNVEELQIVEAYEFNGTCFDSNVYPKLTKISIISCSIGDSYVFPWHTVRHSALVCLELKDVAEIRDEELLVMATVCPNLKSLALSDVVIQSYTLQQIVQICFMIVNLDISDNEYVTDSDILHVVKCLSSLRHLNVHNCVSLTGLSMQYISAHCKHSLQELCVDVETISFEDMACALAECRALWKLSLTLRRSPDKSKWARLLISMARITYLRLRSWGEPPACLYALFGTHCRKLEYLDVAPTLLETNVSVLALARGCPNLHTFRIFTRDSPPEATLALWCKLRPRLTIVKANSRQMPTDSVLHSSLL